MNLQIKLSELKRLIRSAERRKKLVKADWDETYINIQSSGHTFINGNGSSGGFFCQVLLMDLVEEGSGARPTPTFEVHPQDILGETQHHERQDLLLAQETGDRYKLDIVVNQDYATFAKHLDELREADITTKTKKEARQKARNIRNEYLKQVEKAGNFRKEDYIPDYASEPVVYKVYYCDDLLFHINIKELPEVIKS